MFLISIVLAATLAKADVPRVSVTELHELMKKGDAIALDVRGSVPFKLGRIDGATWMPLGLIKERFGELPQDKLVVAYCTCKAEELSLEAVTLLANQHGFTRVAVLQGGYPAWKEAGLPVAADEELAETTKDTTVYFDQRPETATSLAGGGRLRPPDAVKCDRNELTSFAGKVTSYRRGEDMTVLVMHTSADTVETIKVAHRDRDPRHAYLIEAQPFTAADWKRIESKKGVLLPDMSAVAWVCSNGVTTVDWRPGTTFTGAE
ncbi:MAG TPA: rhodanese-like domain-containing protein [Thermoanaerobaculia bacterium]|nr:rhodanese-like domain-containing protein [Thermoanaerobaculia bacterium]